MHQNRDSKLKARGFAFSDISLAYVYIIYMAAMWAVLLVWLPLVHFFPEIIEYEWPILIPTILFGIIFLLHALAWFHSVVLESDKIIVRWFGITLRTIPVSKLRLFCAVGNEREDVLCLSCRPVEEMALLQEKRILRSVFAKHDLPFRKRKPNWQDDLARDYIHSLRRKPFAFLQEHDIVMLEMQPALQYLVQHMYPQLPYRNYTEVTSCYAARFSYTKENQAVCFPLQLYDYCVDMKPDGIHLSTKKKEVSFLPAQHMKSAVRVDIFRQYERGYPHHLPLIVISCLSEEELAAEAPKDKYGEIGEDLPNRQVLLAMMAAAHKTLRWRVKQQDCCVMRYTENNVKTLRRLYPDISFNDIAANWLQDTDTVSPVDNEPLP